MGVWCFFQGELELENPLGEPFKEFFNYYTKKLSWNDPDQPYGTVCPWAINENNKLICTGTKCGDHNVWLRYISTRFFTPYGIRAKGTLNCIWEPGCMPQTQAEVEELPREWGEPWTIDTAEYVRFSCYDAKIMNG